MSWVLGDCGGLGVLPVISLRGPIPETDEKLQDGQRWPQKSSCEPLKLVKMEPAELDQNGSKMAKKFRKRFLRFLRDSEGTIRDHKGQ